MSFRLSYRQDNFERGDIHFPRLLSAISQGFSHERIIDNFHNLRVIHFLRLTREYLNEFFPRKLSLSHNREESANWQDIAFRNDYKKFLTSIAGLDEGSVASLSLVACFGKTSLLQLRNNMGRSHSWEFHAWTSIREVNFSCVVREGSISFNIPYSRAFFK